MENRVGSSFGNEVPKKSRSLDLKSLYEAKEDKKINSLKRKGSSEVGEEKSNKKKKKSRKEVPLSSIKDDNSNSLRSSGSAEVYHCGLSSGLHDSKDPELGLSQKLINGTEFKSVSLSLIGKVIRIPKRKRDFVGRKKFDGDRVLKPVPSCTEMGFIDQIPKVAADDSGAQAESSKAKKKKGFVDFKKGKTSESNSALHLKGKDWQAGHSAVNNGDLPLNKPQKSRRKRKNFVPASKSLSEAEPSINNFVKISDDAHEEEDDEENLEQNAARMLSSRFDPSCTGFSSNSKATASPSMNGLPFHGFKSFVSHGFKSLSGSESASVDAAGRLLRPRKQHKEKGHSRRRKRRHFYEIFSGDLDAYWVLNRRIKVFWPLDQSWYYGLLSDYDKERNLHHVKYDDRDEEWINLQNERFKLLLLPGEVPGKADRKKSAMKDKCPEIGNGNLKFSKDKEKISLSAEDDSCIGSYMDSEPIISWLARRIKPAPFRSVKKSKISDPSLDSVPPFDETVSKHGCSGRGSLQRGEGIFSSSSVLPDGVVDSGKVEISTRESTNCPEGKKRPIVYVRRRYRNQSSEDLHLSSNVPESVTSVSPVAEELDISLDRLLSNGPLWSSFQTGLMTNPLVESKQFKFDLKFPVLSVLNHAFGAQNLWLFHTVMLLQYGTLMPMWPKIHLEMLFIDNIAGLRFLLFEGCLKQAVAFVFLVLTAFHQSNEMGKYVDLELPVTSIRFKFSQCRNVRKQLVFAFHKFSELKNSKWLYLDSMLERHCLFAKQLPLSECTYDNIKALQNGTSQLLMTSTCQEPASNKGMQKRSRKIIGHMGIPRELASSSMSKPYNSDDKHRKILPFALSFTAAPTFFLGLHLKLLMEHSIASISFRDHDSIELSDNSGCLMSYDCSSLMSSPEVTHEKSMDVLSSAACDRLLATTKPDLGTVDFAAHSNGERIKPSWGCLNGEPNVAEVSVASQDYGEKGSDTIVQKQQCNLSESEPCNESPRQLVHEDKYETGSHSCVNGMSVEIPQFSQFGKSDDRELHGAQQSSGLAWNMNGGIIPSPNPTAPRSTWHQYRGSSSSSFGYLSHGWSDGNSDLFLNNFGNGPKKPRTQVSYSLPYGGMEFSSRPRSYSQKGFPHKRIRKASEKKSSEVSRVSQRNLELLSCNANVLITLSDRGWRECGVQVVLEHVDENEWRLAVKLSGNTKYSYKAHQFLQPGSTNRFTHAMMWKGGKDWTLEFPDRSQWALFKEMYEECYNRNFRAALIKNIPIPGVRLIEENDDCGIEVAFVRSSSKYFRQVETDVDMALNPSRVLYDMDSDDEQWIVENQTSLETSTSRLEEVLSMFEKTMDMFEKAAYTQRCDQFTSDEIVGLMDGVGPIEVMKNIHDYWQQKRHTKGMPLIRHLQPPLWERYQQQVKEWELAMSKFTSSFPNGYQKTALIEKPPMFAFCLKPRGLEVPNKGSKQRSQRKLSVSGQSNNIVYQDGFHGFGRRLNGFAFGDEKAIYHGHNYEPLDDSPLSQTSPRVFSPRDTSTGYISTSSDGFDRNNQPKHYRKKSKKFRSSTCNDLQMVASCNQRIMGMRNGVDRWNVGLQGQRSYLSEVSQRHGSEQFNVDEFRLRDASGAAQHALNMAKLKREKAQRLLYRADLAIHKAVVALTTAEAIKACCTEEDPNFDDDE